MVINITKKIKVTHFERLLFLISSISKHSKKFFKCRETLLIPYKSSTFATFLFFEKRRNLEGNLVFELILS